MENIVDSSSRPSVSSRSSRRAFQSVQPLAVNQNPNPNSTELDPFKFQPNQTHSLHPQITAALQSAKRASSEQQTSKSNIDAEVGEDRVSELPGSAAVGTLLLPVSTPRPSESSRSHPTLHTKEIGHASGKLIRIKPTDIEANRTLFPREHVTGSSYASSASGSTSNASIAASSLLQQNVSQILTTKESARKYIEMMRRRMLQYMTLNKEYASSHANEQLRQKGISALKKTLTSRIAQLEHLQSILQKQQTNKDQISLQRIHTLQQEVNDLQQQAVDDSKKHAEELQMLQERLDFVNQQIKQQQKEFEKQLEKADTQMIRKEGDANQRIDRLESENLRLQASTDQLSSELNQARVENRILQSRHAMESTLDETPDSSKEMLIRLELALETSCGEVDRLDSLNRSLELRLEEAKYDIREMFDISNQMEAAKEKLQLQCQQLDSQLQQLTQAHRQQSIELDEAHELRQAYERAYEAAVVEKSQLEQAMQSLIDSSEHLQQQLCELMLEQANTIPLPLHAIDSNTELTILLASAGAEQTETEDDEESLHVSSNIHEQRRSVRSAPSSPQRSSLLSDLDQVRSMPSSTVASPIKLLTDSAKLRSRTSAARYEETSPSVATKVSARKLSFSSAVSDRGSRILSTPLSQLSGLATPNSTRATSRSLHQIASATSGSSTLSLPSSVRSVSQRPSSTSTSLSSLTYPRF